MAPLLEVRSFLSILSLRSGLWVLCSVALMLSILGSVASGLEMSILLVKGRSLQLLDEVLLFVQMVLFGLLGLVSMFGILSGILKRGSIVKVSNRLALAQAVLMLGALGLALYASLRSVDNDDVDFCIGPSTDWVVVQFCQGEFSLVRIFPIIWFSLACVIQTWTFVIGANYVEELDVEKASRISGSFTIKSFMAWEDSKTKHWVSSFETYSSYDKSNVV